MLRENMSILYTAKRSFQSDNKVIFRLSKTKRDYFLWIFATWATSGWFIVTSIPTAFLYYRAWNAFLRITYAITFAISNLHVTQVLESRYTDTWKAEVNYVKVKEFFQWFKLARVGYVFCNKEHWLIKNL